MGKGKTWKHTGTTFRRGTVLVWTAVSSSVLVGFTALAVDLGYLKVVKGQMQNTADAGAMAGASAFFDSRNIGQTTSQDIIDLARQRVEEYVTKNPVEGQALQLATADIVVGYLAHPENPNDVIVTGGTTPYNAVQVTLKKEPGGINGPVQLFFSSIWGKQDATVIVNATAVINNHVSGYKPGDSKGPLIPVTVRYQKYVDEIENGGGDDCYGYDPETGEVTEGPDGIPEISIYPEKTKKNNPAGSGNFGLLDMENGNSSVNPVGEQIRNGITAEDLQRTIGSTSISFYDDNGNNITHNIGGTPGLKASLKDDFEFRVGDTIGYFVHTTVSENGTNCSYTITDIKYGRLLFVSLTGDGKAIVVQPTVYTGPEVLTKPQAPRNNSAGKIMLAR